MSEITKEQKKLLEPFGQMFAQMDERVREMSDEDLVALLAACRATSTTNCWYCAYAAAKYLLREIETQMYQRKQRAEAVTA